jgi:hypothetical protein
MKWYIKLIIIRIIWMISKIFSLLKMNCEKIPIKKKESKIKDFETPTDFLKWNNVHKNELKELKTNILNKMINILDYRLRLRNNQWIII